MYKRLLVKWLNQGLICLPEILVKIGYSAQNSAWTPLIKKKSARSLLGIQNIFGPLGRTYFLKYRRERGPDPPKLIRYLDTRNAKKIVIHLTFNASVL